MKSGAFDLIGKQHPIRILLLLRDEGPMRFSEIEQVTGLNPAQVDRALKLLREGMWIIPETLPEDEGPVHVHYQIANRGEALLHALDDFRDSLVAQREAIGPETFDELKKLYA